MENDTPTSALKGHRTLATVVFTDCVGFSARMSADEDHTLKLIHRDLKLMKKMCEQFEGRVLKSTGDGLLLHFNSAVKAVEFAIEIQRSLIEAAAKLPPKDSLQHRIGIHLADIFITETDVMGNGVNIAARLQGAAEPGGICISQTVYDVVKAGLQFDTEYLGPRELKNIREIVPVYKVLLAPTQNSLDRYTDVARSLEQNPHLLRIKKLLFYVCKNLWESDQGKVETLDLRDLLRQLLGQSPTPDKLRLSLDAAVKTLSKQAEYAYIAQLIVEDVSQLYAQESESPGIVTALDSKRGDSIESSQQLLYEQLAQELEQSDQCVRVKKLLVYICTNRWESDPQQLSQLELQDLIPVLHRLAPTLEQLRWLVSRFVQTLSKQAEYAVIASSVIDKLQVLYLTPALAAPLPDADYSLSTLIGVDSSSNAAPVTAIDTHSELYSEIATALQAQPNSLRMKKLLFYVSRRHWESDSTKLSGLSFAQLLQEMYRTTPTLKQLELSLDAVVKTLNKQTEYSAIAQTLLTQVEGLYRLTSDTVLSPVEVSVEVAEPEDLRSDPPSQPSLNLVDTRLEIMRYANPLRAKILLFAAMYEDFDFTNQDWLNLRMHELDELLRHVLRSCTSYTDLEALLYSTARRLPELEEMVKTADVVAKCLRSVYLYGNRALILQSSHLPEQPLDDFEMVTQELTGTGLSGYTGQRSAAPLPATLLNPVSAESISATQASDSNQRPVRATNAEDHTLLEPPLENDRPTQGDREHARE